MFKNLSAQKRRLMVGKQINQFRIEGIAGKGGVGVVYRGFDTKLRRNVALKVLRDDKHISTQAKHLFSREARAAAKLSHPNVATVYDTIETADGLIIIYEWVDGGSLAGRYFTNPDTWSELLSLLSQIASGLDAAHMNGVVHRDLKPSNILITLDNTVKICDFGVAQIMDASTIEDRGLVVGTLGRMAPEQIQGKVVDYRADIFALGVMLYEFVTGSMPFTGDSPASVLHAIQAAEPSLPSKVNHSLPSSIDAALLKALSKRPDLRQSSARELAESLRPLSGEPLGLSGRPTRAARHSDYGSKLLVTLSVVAADALEQNVDVLIMKYAQELHGLDLGAVVRLNDAGIDIRQSLPSVGESLFVETKGAIGAKYIEFVGTNPLWSFGYEEIRELGRNAVKFIASDLPDAQSIAMTLHGPGRGLDETECLLSQLSGMRDAIYAGEFPRNVEKIILCEISEARAKLIEEVATDLLPNMVFTLEGPSDLLEVSVSTQIARQPEKLYSKTKPYAFIAMPTGIKYEDIYHYGIRGAVTACGLLCERRVIPIASEDTVKTNAERIMRSSAFIAELSEPDPHTYMDVGYALARDRTIVVLAHASSERLVSLPNSILVRYQLIHDLENELRQTLMQIKSNSA